MPHDRNDSRKANRRLMQRAMQGVALAVVLTCAGTAARAGDDSSSDSLYTRLMRTLGLKDPRTMEYGINYSERSPLVVPPNRDLPPPQAAAPPPVPDWPKDPDIRKREQAKKKDKVGPHPDWVLESDRALRPDELNPPGMPRASGNGAQNANGGADADERYANGSKKSIFSFDWFKKEQYATFTGEPARTSLTDPPPGYQTPSPDQPYGVGSDKKKYKPPTVAERMEPTR